MYDCFNMAYQDNANALQLHIKINSENLLPVPQKYNAGSLRIPADPSWPKIPQRKLIDDVGDTIEPPCIVTLTGTPRRSRTVVQTPLNQSPKSTVTKDSAYSSFHHHKATSSMHTLKRLPGYVDPRFKKVTHIKKNQVSSTELLQKNKNQSVNTSTKHLYREDMERQIPDRNSNMGQIKMQEAEKPHEEEEIESQNHKESNKFNANKESIAEQNYSINNPVLRKRSNILEADNKNETAENDKGVTDEHSIDYVLKSTVNDANTQVDITSLPVRENNGQLFFVLDKKLQSHPLNTITVPQEYVNQCYNVQLPVLAYQNIPMQVSPTGTNNGMQQCINHSEYKNLNETPSLTRKKSEQYINLNKIQHINKSINDTEKRKICEKETVLVAQSSAPEEGRKNCFNSDLPKNLIPEKLQSLNIQQKQQESSDSEYYIPNINKKNINNHVLQCLKMKKIACNTSGEETTDSEFIPQRNIKKNQFTDTNKLTMKVNKISTDIIHGDTKTSIQSDSQINLSKENEYLQSVPQSNVISTNQNQSLYQNYKTAMCENTGRNKSEQNLPCAKNECARKLCRNSEPYITFKQKKASAKFSRKAKSYFQKNSHSALVDSDYTLVWPNCQYTKYKYNQANIHKSSNHKVKKVRKHINPIPVHKQNTNTQINNASKFIEQNYLQNNKHINSCQEMITNLSKTCLQKENCKCDVSPRSNTDDVCERSKSIPPKTQELLNKSYWEYYNKLRHKIKNTSSIEQQYPYELTADALEKGKRGKVNEVYDKELRSQLKVDDPELQTLQQCTALSTMINKALDTNLQSDIVQTKQLYMNDNMKLPSNHKVDVKDSNTKKISQLIDDNPVPSKLKCKENKKNDKQFLELKSIIFFGGMMYILIIFLPMLYDYFSYEEYDDYENLSYLEMIVEYILSSYKEAFGGVFSGVKQIFFYPHTCKKCNTIA